MITSQVDKTGPFLITALPQVIPVGFPFQSSADLLVLDAGASGTGRDPAVTLTLGSDYTVTGGGYNAANQMQTGSITVAGTGAHTVIVGDQVTIMRAGAINQPTSFLPSGPRTIALLEQALDMRAALEQQINELASRALQFERVEVLSPLLRRDLRASKYLAFDSSGAITFPSGSTSPLGDVSSTSVISTGSTTSRTLANRFAEITNVKDFGAVGVAGVDDTAAINAATAYVDSIGGGAVFFPFTPDGYTTDGIKYYDNMTFIPGAKGTLIKKKAGSVARPLFDAADNGVAAISNVQWLPGFILDGNKANLSTDSNQIGIKLQGAINILIDGIEIKDCALDSIFLYGSGASRTLPCQNIVIRNALLTGGKRTNMAIITAQDVVVEDTIMSDGGDVATASTANMDIEPDAATDVLKNITFSRVTFRDAVYRGVALVPNLANRNDANILFDSCSFLDNGTYAFQSLNNAYTIGPVIFNNCRSSGNVSGTLDLNRIYKGAARGCEFLESTGFALNIGNNNVAFSVTNSVLKGGTASNVEYDFAINDSSNTDTFVGADVQFVNNRFILGGTGSIWAMRQSVFKVTKVANGVKGCTSANGCYVVNDGVTLITAITAANPQNVALASVPANTFIYKGSQYSVTPITGVTTATMTVGNNTSGTLYSSTPYDLKAAASATNFLDFTTAAARSTKAADVIRIPITYTGGDGTNVANGSEFIVTLLWGTEMSK